MNKRDTVYHLKGRWKEIGKREKEELKNTPFEVRFLQTSALMRFAAVIYRKRKNDKEEQVVRRHWKILRERSLKNFKESLG